MESFRIVDFLSPIARPAGFMTADVRANVRARCPLLVQPVHDRKYKRILFKFSKSPVFCNDEALARECFPESDRDPPSSRGEGRTTAVKAFPVPVIFIIDVKNILEALINVGDART